MSVLVEPSLPPAIAGPAVWEGLPAVQQPHWRYHADYLRTREALALAPPLVGVPELAALRDELAAVARGDAMVLQAGDCAENITECTPSHTAEKLSVLHRLADRLTAWSGHPTVRVGRMAGQFAKPRSEPVERHGDQDLPVFRGHMVNSEEPTLAGREHDPSRMLWAHEMSGVVLSVMHTDRRHRASYGMSTGGSGPWASHEALVIDYEGSSVRAHGDGLSFLSSTHLPWVGERTRQPYSAHVRLLSATYNPAGCKVGPTTSVTELLQLCELLDPGREPGRLVLMVRMGIAKIEQALPPLVDAVHRAGHPAIWLSDPMHGNTVRTADGLKTRRLSDLAAEAAACRAILERHGEHAAGLHLEVAADDVTECLGGPVRTEEMVGHRYTTLCDPRLNPEQAVELLEAWT